jgi:GrpB-like predicted nucleotidyltransferase (UPF0157 family)
MRIARDTLAGVIEIVPYQDRWRPEFAAIAHRLRSALGPAALRIDHIGSTAVPGLAAKDVGSRARPTLEFWLGARGQGVTGK